MPIPATHASSAPAATQPGAPAATQTQNAFHIGTLLLLGATVASGFLAAHRLIGFAIPGCGAGAGCDKLTKSVWGSVPGLLWPVSYVGLAYFAGMLVAWIMARGQATKGMHWLARLGALASLLFLGVMASEQTLCPYCLAAHVANLMFWVVSEFSNRGLVDRSPLRAAASKVAIGFFTVSAVLGMAEVRANEKNRKDQEAATAKMAATLPNQPTPAPIPAPTGPTTAAQPQPPTPAATGTPEPSKAFTGRYRLGPENAPIRIVMITDYGCPDCRHFEGQAMQLLAAYPGKVSLSTKHFPFCTDCNKTPNTPNLHPNSCWAARAAETAGMLYGNDGFWKMHRWLFENKGVFTDEPFRAGLASLGFDRARFEPLMMSMEPLALVQADIAEANHLGLRSTPMMFINGVELMGWGSDAFALKNAVDALAAKAPAAAPPVVDQPINAQQRLAAEAAAVIDQWRDEKKTPAMAWPDRKPRPWVNLPDSVPIRISLWGDLLEPNCAEADKTIREALMGRSDIRYEFRSFPFDQACNPTLPRSMFPQGCRAARAAEAAGQIGVATGKKQMQAWVDANKAQVAMPALRDAAAAMGLDPDLFQYRMEMPGAQGDMATKAVEAAGHMVGHDAYWRVHIWIIEHQKEFSDATLKAAAAGLGLNGDDLIKRMNDQDIADTIAWDVNIGGRIHLPEIPRVFINGKVITRPLLKDQFIIERIIAEVEKKK